MINSQFLFICKRLHFSLVHDAVLLANVVTNDTYFISTPEKILFHCLLTSFLDFKKSTVIPIVILQQAIHPFFLAAFIPSLCVCCFLKLYYNMSAWMFLFPAWKILEFLDLQIYIICQLDTFKAMIFKNIASPYCFYSLFENLSKSMIYLFIQRTYLSTSLSYFPYFYVVM